VEDDALLGLYLAEMLVAMGYDICAIESTEADAVAAAIQHAPDLMIVDARLRDGSGISAVEQILRVRPIRHVFVSGDVESVQEARPRAVVLRKPFREKDLASAIRSASDASTIYPEPPVVRSGDRFPL
jgi:CheY-like chemotaxis protein